MAAYGFLISAYVYDLLNIGLIGHRGRIILGLIGVALAAAWIQGPAGWAGLAAGVATVLVIRRVGVWLHEEDGLHTMWILLIEGATWVAGYAGDMVRWVCIILSPTTREDPIPVLDHEAPQVSAPVDTAYATPIMMRWTPAAAPAPEAADTAQVPPVTSVETYASVIGEVASHDRPFNETAQYVADRYRVSRSKFARDVRARREENAA